MQRRKILKSIAIETEISARMLLLVAGQVVRQAHHERG